MLEEVCSQPLDILYLSTDIYFAYTKSLVVGCRLCGVFSLARNRRRSMGGVETYGMQIKDLRDPCQTTGATSLLISPS